MEAVYTFARFDSEQVRQEASFILTIAEIEELDIFAFIFMKISVEMLGGFPNLYFIINSYDLKRKNTFVYKLLSAYASGSVIHRCSPYPATSKGSSSWSPFCSNKLCSLCDPHDM
jgi:hypothetical protein